MCNVVVQLEKYTVPFFILLCLTFSVKKPTVRNECLQIVFFLCPIQLQWDIETSHIWNGSPTLHCSSSLSPRIKRRLKPPFLSWWCLWEKRRYGCSWDIRNYISTGSTISHDSGQVGSSIQFSTFSKPIKLNNSTKEINVKYVRDQNVKVSNSTPTTSLLSCPYQSMGHHEVFPESCCNKVCQFTF